MVGEHDGWPEMRAARKKAGMQLKTLAQRCGKSSQFINDIEKGNRFGGPTAHCIARELGMDVVEADLHHYRFLRMPAELIFGDEEHVRQCLAVFREMLMSESWRNGAENDRMVPTKTRTGVACNEPRPSDGHLGMSKEPLMPQSISDTPHLTSSQRTCTIVRAPVWRATDPYSPYEQGVAEALYGADRVLIVVSDWGPIAEDDWRWEGCDAVERRDLAETIFGYPDEPTWPHVLSESDLRAVTPSCPAGTWGGDGAR